MRPKLVTWRGEFPFNVHPGEEPYYEGKVNVLILRIGRWTLEFYLSRKKPLVWKDEE